jgi:hypothetical protein
MRDGLGLAPPCPSVYRGGVAIDAEPLHIGRDEFDIALLSRGWRVRSFGARELLA